MLHRLALPEIQTTDMRCIALTYLPSTVGGVTLTDAAETPYFAVVVRRNAFATAERSLTRQGLQVFAPKIEKPVRRFGKTIGMRSLLFPGYVFVKDPSDVLLWRAVRSTEGVARLVMGTAGRPSPLPNGFVEALKARCDDEDVLVTGDKLQVGEAVSIVSGPFAGFVSKIEHIDEQQRIWVLLDLLGSSRSISVPSAHLVRAQHSSDRRSA